VGLLGKGQSFTVLSNNRELSPTQAAELLGVSRGHFMRAIQNGSVPFRRVGTHYRVRLDDVLKYREARLRRRQFLDELTDQAQEPGMGY
jgi:excisionase family DNA binding protein